MRIDVHRFTALVLCMLLSFTMYVPVAKAAGEISTRIPVSVTTGGLSPDPAEAYTVRLTANDDRNPMPDGQLGGSFDIVINGPGEAAFPAIEFIRVGIYEYTVEQIKGHNPACEYDDNVYTVKFTVTNEGDGSFAITVSLHEEGTDAKPGRIEFRNVYEDEDEPPTPTRPPEKPTDPILPTGVSDRWMIYLAGSALLLAAAIGIICVLRHKEDE